MIGGIDLGGTKIEARAFDLQLREKDRRRIPTPNESYTDLLDALQDQVEWLTGHGEILAIGLGSPGLIHPDTGVMLTANLPVTGHKLGHDLSKRVGRTVHLINDCRAATLSEAVMGAAKGARNVVGLTLGTGVAGGHVVEGALVPDANGQHGEYGHLPIPAHFAQRYALPLRTCGCGLQGCFETYLAGPGLARLAEHLTGRAASPEIIMTETAYENVRGVWLDLAGDLISVIQRTADPDIIVLSGGLGMAEDLPDMLAKAALGKGLNGTQLPKIVQAQHGAASGALGAALFAARAEGIDR